MLEVRSWLLTRGCSSILRCLWCSPWLGCRDAEHRPALGQSTAQRFVPLLGFTKAAAPQTCLHSSRATGDGEAGLLTPTPLFLEHSPNPLGITNTERAPSGSWPLPLWEFTRSESLCGTHAARCWSERERLHTHWSHLGGLGDRVWGTWEIST